LFTGDDNGQLLQDLCFRNYGMDKGTCISAAEADEVLQDFRAIYKTSFTKMQAQPALIQRLSLKYHKPLLRVMDQLDANPSHIDAVTELATLSKAGAIMTETKETFLYAAHPLSFHPKREGVEGYAAYCFDNTTVADISAMGIPRTLAPELLDVLKQEYIQTRQLSIDYAPNSAKVHRQGMTKATPVEWLAGVRSYVAQSHSLPGPCLHGTINLAQCIAVGDNPSGNDRPLAWFQDQGMAFVSVADNAADVAESLLPRHIGRLEHGTAALWGMLMDHWSEVQASSSLAAGVDVVLAAVRAQSGST
jgi:hypothetical protein